MVTTKKAAAKTKKTAPKKTAVKTKKAAVKKTAKKSATVRALVCAAGEECFWTTDGRVLENLEQLRIAFGSMNEDVFLHHVTKEKNDFADWVEHVLEDVNCAAALRKARKLKTAEAAVVRCLKLYQL